MFIKKIALFLLSHILRQFKYSLKILILRML